MAANVIAAHIMPIAGVVKVTGFGKITVWWRREHVGMPAGRAS